MRVPLGCCVVALAALGSGCQALEGDRAKSAQLCMEDFGSREFCACAEDELQRRLSWVERRTFRAQEISPNESALANGAVRACAERVKLDHWPKTSLKGLRAACKGPEASCQCMEAAVSREVPFAALTAAGAVGKLQDDPQFKAAMKHAVTECPEAFFAEGAPWPESAVNKMVETCMKGNEATRSYCECLAGKVSKRLSMPVIIRVGAGDQAANEQMQAVVHELAPECLEAPSPGPAPAPATKPAKPAPHTHRRKKAR